MDPAELNRRFTYHPPTPERAAQHELLRSQARAYAAQVLEHTPHGREQSLAITALEESLFWANAALARPSTTPQTATPETTMTDELLDLINAERATAGSVPLQANENLTAAAVAHARDMAQGDYFSHTSADGRSAKDRAVEHGYTAYGAENIARGQRTPQATVTSWMNSDGHRRNLLNPELVAVGLGVAERSEGGPVWVAKFGRSVAS